MSNPETTERIDDEEEVTDNGFDTVLCTLRRGEFNNVQAIRLIHQANQLAGDNINRLLQLRRSLIQMFGSRIGDNTRVVIEIFDEKDQPVVLFV